MNKLGVFYGNGGRIVGTMIGSEDEFKAQSKITGKSFIIVDDQTNVTAENSFIGDTGRIFPKVKIKTLVYPDVVTVKETLTISGFPPNTLITWPNGLVANTLEEEVSLIVEESAILVFKIDHPYFFLEEITINTNPLYIQPPASLGISDVVILGNHFNSGQQVRCTRIGNQVTIQGIDVNLTHPESSAVYSDSNCIPFLYRPIHKMENVYSMSATTMLKVTIETSGQLILSYVNTSLNGVQVLDNSVVTPSITYTV